MKAFYYVPCDAGRGCDEKTADCAPCPLERVYQGVSCCVAIDRPCVNMRGESIGTAASRSTRLLLT